jgi:hypothetical protein
LPALLAYKRTQMRPTTLYPFPLSYLIPLLQMTKSSLALNIPG